MNVGFSNNEFRTNLPNESTRAIYVRDDDFDIPLEQLPRREDCRFDSIRFRFLVCVSSGSWTSNAGEDEREFRRLFRDDDLPDERSQRRKEGTQRTNLESRTGGDEINNGGGSTSSFERGEERCCLLRARHVDRSAISRLRVKGASDPQEENV